MRGVCAPGREGTLRDGWCVRAANVNFAAEKATVEYDSASVGLERLVGAVEDAGYGVVREAQTGDVHAREYGKLRGDFLVAGVLTALILVSSLPHREYGFLNPVLAAAAMALSSVTVVSNALRLRRVKVSQ